MTAARIRTLGAFLAQARKKKGLSQKSVADALGYSTFQFVSNWERGVSSPPAKTIHRLAQLYGLSADRIHEEIVEYSVARLRAEMAAEYENCRKGRRNS